MSFGGMRVLALESRRTTEMAELIRRQGGDPFVAPSLREAPVEQSQETFAFAERLFAGEFDMMILLTGVGTRQLNRLLATRFPETAFPDALRRLTIVARGPKPVAALRETVDMVRRLLAGERVTAEGKVVTLHEGRLQFTPVRKAVPI